MSKIEIHKYEKCYRDEWDKFIDESNNGTMFHKQAFLDYHHEGKFNFYSLMFRKKGQLIAVLPGGVSGDNDAYWSPMGASYGSVVSKDLPFETSLELIDCVMDYFRRNNFKHIYMIPPPIIYNKVYNQHIEYAMLYRRFDFEYSYISHTINMLQSDDFFDYFDPQARRMIRKTLREQKIRVEESTDFAAFYPILESNKQRHNVKPTHSLADLIRLYELMPEHLKLFLVYKDDIPIAGSLLFLANSKISLCFYIMMDYNYKELKPVFLAMYESVRWSKENGYEWFDIGVSQDTAAEDPMTPALSLISFKERFHARGILRSTYHYEFK